MTDVSLRDRLIAYALLPAVTPARFRLLLESFDPLTDVCNAPIRFLQGLLSMDAADAETIRALFADPPDAEVMLFDAAISAP